MAEKKIRKNDTQNRIISALRLTWRNRGENYKAALAHAKVEWTEGRKSVAYRCQHCGTFMRATEVVDGKSKQPFQIDHIVGVRSEPWDINNPDWNLFMTRLFHGQCELLCRACHALKTKTERAILKKKETTTCASSTSSTPSKSRAAKPRSTKSHRSTQ
jgi:hypothetical protein